MPTMETTLATGENETRGTAPEILRGMVTASPLLLAVVAYGLVFGAEAAQKGLRFLEVPLMTGSNYAGGSEFAAIGLWAAPPPLPLIVAVTLLINSRHLVMGAALAPYLRHLPFGKALVALFFMSDECWALSYADTQKRAAGGHRLPFSAAFYAGCAGIIYLGWLGSTTVGAAVGSMLGDVEAYGFDMAFPAVFLVLLAGLWTGRHAAWPWLVSLAVAAGTHLVLPGAWYVIAGTAAGLGAACAQVKSE
jgi:4-azaleucine resistance transporter AzlC